MLWVCTAATVWRIDGHGSLGSRGGISGFFDHYFLGSTTTVWRIYWCCVECLISFGHVLSSLLVGSKSTLLVKGLNIGP